MKPKLSGVKNTEQELSGVSSQEVLEKVPVLLALKSTVPVGSAKSSELPTEATHTAVTLIDTILG
jgi:hypothetical protein